jgi:hypothetical protein
MACCPRLVSSRAALRLEHLPPRPPNRRPAVVTRAAYAILAEAGADSATASLINQFG